VLFRSKSFESQYNIRSDEKIEDREYLLDKAKENGAADIYLLLQDPYAMDEGLREDAKAIWKLIIYGIVPAESSTKVVNDWLRKKNHDARSHLHQKFLALGYPDAKFEYGISTWTEQLRHKVAFLANKTASSASLFPLADIILELEEISAYIADFSTAQDDENLQVFPVGSGGRTMPGGIHVNVTYSHLLEVVLVDLLQKDKKKIVNSIKSKRLKVNLFRLGVSVLRRWIDDAKADPSQSTHAELVHSIRTQRLIGGADPDTSDKGGRPTLLSHLKVAQRDIVNHVSQEVIKKGLPLAAGMLRRAPSEVTFANDRFQLAGTDRSVSLEDVATEAAMAHMKSLPAALEFNASGGASLYSAFQQANKMFEDAQNSLLRLRGVLG